MRGTWALLVTAAASHLFAAGAAAQRVPTNYRSGSVLHIYGEQKRVPGPPPGIGQLRSDGPVAGGTVLDAAAKVSVRASVPAHVSWSATDVALAGAFTVALLIDAAQTRSLAQSGWGGFRETNPILGPHPSVGQLNTYTAVSGLTVLGAAALVPARVRPWLLGAALAVETFTVAGTVRQGIPIKFP